MGNLMIGDIVLHEKKSELMTVIDVNEGKVKCQWMTSDSFDEDELILTSRPNVISSDIQIGEYIGEVHVYDPEQIIETDKRERIGYGKVYRYDGRIWVVSSKGQVYPAIQDSENSYLYYDGAKAMCATLEESHVAD